MSTRNYEYLGVFIDDRTKEKLLKVIGAVIPENWKVYLDHCTLVHCSNPDQTVVPFLELFIGTNVRFNVTGYGKSKRACAFMVDLPSMNKVSHITIACAPGAKPVESNDIQDWYPFYEPVECWGWLGAVYKDNG